MPGTARRGSAAHGLAGKSGRSEWWQRTSALRTVWQPGHRTPRQGASRLVFARLGTAGRVGRGFALQCTSRFGTAGAPRRGSASRCLVWHRSARPARHVDASCGVSSQRNATQGMAGPARFGVARNGWVRRVTAGGRIRSLRIRRRIASQCEARLGRLGQARPRPVRHCNAWRGRQGEPRRCWVRRSGGPSRNGTAGMVRRGRAWLVIADQGMAGAASPVWVRPGPAVMDRLGCARFGYARRGRRVTSWRRSARDGMSTRGGRGVASRSRESRVKAVRGVAPLRTARPARRGAVRCVIGRDGRGTEISARQARKARRGLVRCGRFGNASQCTAWLVTAVRGSAGGARPVRARYGLPSHRGVWLRSARPARQGIARPGQAWNASYRMVRQARRGSSWWGLARSAGARPSSAGQARQVFAECGTSSRGGTRRGWHGRRPRPVEVRPGPATSSRGKATLGTAGKAWQVFAPCGELGQGAAVVASFGLSLPGLARHRWHGRQGISRLGVAGQRAALARCAC
jgi:hypothetical protein